MAGQLIKSRLLCQIELRKHWTIDNYLHLASRLQAGLSFLRHLGLTKCTPGGNFGIMSSA
jgi:hypothetical protein